MTNDSDSFIKEVDESLRQDRVLDALKRYGPWAAGAFGLVLVGVLAWQGWQGMQRNSAQEHANDYVAAQRLAQQGEFAAAKTAFDALIEEGPNSYRIMARMEAAAMLQEQGDLEGALAGFDEAARRAGDPILRQTAQMRAAYIAADTQDFEALRTRLEPLTGDSSRFAYLARELLAVEAWEAGDLALARETLQALTLAFDAPQAVRQRAQMALAVIGPGPATAEGADAPAPSEGESK